MKPKDIVIGRKYIHKDINHVSCVYLGFGYLYARKQIKGLVIIKYSDPAMIGARVVPIKQNPKFWRGIVPKTPAKKS